MTDIVERLRDEAREQKQGGAYPSTVSVMKEAADEIERLRKENTALKQALGYPVPADDEVVDNPFRCGTCEARTDEIERLRAALSSFKPAAVKEALIKAGCTSPDGTFVRASTNQVIAALSGKFNHD